MSTETNIEAILQNIEGNMQLREGLKDTPDRVVRMYKEVFDGYRQKPESFLKKTFDKELEYETDDAINNGIVVVKNIDFFSHCEHHLVPFFGKMHVGYIPKNRVVGLSKIVRVVNAYAHRLQVQERLTEQVANCIYKELECEGVIVVANAVHLCMVMRGVKNSSASTTTSCVRGCFSDLTTRNEFMHLLKM